jgi:carbonic anhydrase
VFLNVQEGTTSEFLEQLTNHLESVKDPDQDPVELDRINFSQVADMVDGKYWTYHGSLTTPACFESVRWIVMKDPLAVSEAQLEAFRKVDSGSGPLSGNFRPVQPLNGRVVKCSCGNQNNEDS